MSAQDLLLEIGCEELPASYVNGALKAMPALLGGALDAARIGHGEIIAYGSPRRLTVLARSVADAQPDLDEEVLGPPKSAAFGADGKPRADKDGVVKVWDSVHWGTNGATAGGVGQGVIPYVFDPKNRRRVATMRTRLAAAAAVRAAVRPSLAASRHAVPALLAARLCPAAPMTTGAQRDGVAAATAAVRRSVKKKVALTVAFDGTRFAGSQWNGPQLPSACGLLGGAGWRVGAGCACAC